MPTPLLHRGAIVDLPAFQLTLLTVETDGRTIDLIVSKSADGPAAAPAHRLHGKEPLAPFVYSLF